jgi:delta8-fatty-acid desaturase
MNIYTASPRPGYRLCLDLTCPEHMFKNGSNILILPVFPPTLDMSSTTAMTTSDGYSQDLKVSTKPVLDRHTIAQRICSGELLFIYHSLVINASAWSAKHPGGVLAILHFVGRDATDEVEAYHSTEAIARLRKYAIGRVEYDDEIGWAALTPPIALGLIRHPNGVKGDWKREGAVRLAGGPDDGPDGIVKLTAEELEPMPSELDLRMERRRSKAYHGLKHKLMDAGLFEWPGPLIGYGKDLARYSVLGGLAFGLFFL